MKIYFAGSIRGGRQDAELYYQLIDEIKKYGDVLTEHVGASELDEDATDLEIHARDLDWLREADVIIAEVTNPSHGVGYEVGHAVTMKKDVYCLYRQEEKRLSAMLNGSPTVESHKYNTIEEARSLLKEILRNIKSQSIQIYNEYRPALAW